MSLFIGGKADAVLFMLQPLNRAYTYEKTHFTFVKKMLTYLYLQVFEEVVHISWATS